MVGSVRVQIVDAQLAGCLLEGRGLFDQGGDGVTHNLIARLITQSLSAADQKS